MNDYEAIGIYALFALVVFSFGMIWRFSKDTLKKRFHLLNYHSKDSDPKVPHVHV
jgi:hypothetical protein